MKMLDTKGAPDMAGDNQSYNPQGSYSQPAQHTQFDEPSYDSYGGMNQAKPRVEQKNTGNWYRRRRNTVLEKENQMAEKKKIRKKYCKYTEMKVDFVDYKNTDLLKLSMSERGKLCLEDLQVTLKLSRNGWKTIKKSKTHGFSTIYRWY